MKEINENLTILLGVTSSQGRDIKVIKEDTSSIKDRLDRLEAQSYERQRYSMNRADDLTS